MSLIEVTENDMKQSIGPSKTRGRQPLKICSDMIVLCVLLDVLAFQYVMQSTTVLKHDIYHFIEEEPVETFLKSVNSIITHLSKPR